MNYDFFFNDNSKFTSEFNYDMVPIIVEAFHGLVNIGEVLGDTYTLYADNVNNLMDILLAENYKLQDFFDLCINEYPEIAHFLTEIMDKSPFIDYISEGDFETLTTDTYYIEGETIDNIIPLAFSGLFNIYLFSLNTKKIWSESEIIVSKLDEKFQYGSEKLNVQNISSNINSDYFKQLLYAVDIEKIGENLVVEPCVLNWFNDLIKENKKIIFSKLKFAYQYDFKVSSNLIKPLSTEYQGQLKVFHEVMIDSISGGTMRILYKKIENKIYLLTAWLKKSDLEGYDKHMKIAAKRIIEIEKPN